MAESGRRRRRRIWTECLVSDGRLFALQVALDGLVEERMVLGSRRTVSPPKRSERAEVSAPGAFVRSKWEEIDPDDDPKLKGALTQAHSRPRTPLFK